MNAVSPYVLKGKALRTLYASVIVKLAVSSRYDVKESPAADCDDASLISWGTFTIEAALIMAMPRALETPREMHSVLREERSRRWRRDAWHWGPRRFSAKLSRGAGSEVVRVRMVGLRGARVRSRRSILRLGWMDLCPLFVQGML